MNKIILIFLVLVILAGGIFLLWKPDFWKKPNIVSRAPNAPKILGKSTSQNKVNVEPENLLNQGSDKLKQVSNTAISDVKNNLYDSAQIALDKVFDKERSGVNVNISLAKDQANSVLIIDLSKEMIKTRLQRNTSYNLQFKNVPEHSCIYIGEGKYEINEQKQVSVEFQKIGNYSIKINNCNVADKVIGELTVE